MDTQIPRIKPGLILTLGKIQKLAASYKNIWVKTQKAPAEKSWKVVLAPGVTQEKYKLRTSGWNGK